jgi:hypothetical protein
MSKQKRPIDDIAPDDFLSTWGASTYEQAIEKAEQAPTTTPDSELPRCPVCGTQRVYPRGTKGSAGQGRENDTDYVCSDRHHFDDPVFGDPDGDVEDDEPGEEADRDPFEWVAADELAEPPLRRLLDDADKETLTALALYCYRPWEDAGPSYQELGEFFGYSRQWVGERVRGWRDGEYRDLVPDPRPWRVDE